MTQPTTATPASTKSTRLPPWTELHGPLAKKMGKLLRELVGSEDPYDQRFIHGRLYADSEYRQWVRRRLREDNFMARIGAGIELLPDIREKLPFIQAWIETQNRPRTLPAMMRHMCRNLEWYLDRGRELRVAKVNQSLLKMTIGVVVFLVSAGLGPSLQTQNQPVRLIGLIWLGLFLAILGTGVFLNFLDAAIIVLYQGTACGEKPASMKHTINAAELYLYLHELYEERGLTPLAAEKIEASRLARSTENQLAFDPADQDDRVSAADAAAASQELRQRREQR